MPNNGNNGNNKNKDTLTNDAAPDTTDDGSFYFENEAYDDYSDESHDTADDENDNDNDNENKECFDITACEKFVCKAFDVSVPVTVTPFAIAQKPEVKCIGDVEVTNGIEHCDERKKDFEFTITQKIKVKIPVEFGADTCFEESCSEEDKDSEPGREERE